MEEKEILDLYTQEEILDLAKKQLSQGKNEVAQLEFSITKIDKDYKIHNAKAITKALVNGGLVILFASIILNSNSDVSRFGNQDLINLVDSIAAKMNFSPFAKNMNEIIYPFTFGLLNNLIEKLGIIGLVIAVKSMKLITNSVNDARKSIIMRNELNLLNEKMNIAKEMEGKHVR
jgi:hypothetical protein